MHTNTHTRSAVSSAPIANTPKPAPVRSILTREEARQIVRELLG